MKKRSLVTLVLLTIVTCGIYGLYWFCSFQNQLKKETGMGFGGFGHLVMSVVTLGIYDLYWVYAVGKRLEVLGGRNNGGLYLYMALTGIGLAYVFLLMQNEANYLPETAEVAAPAEAEVQE